MEEEYGNSSRVLFSVTFGFWGVVMLAAPALIGRLIGRLIPEVYSGLNVPLPMLTNQVVQWCGMFWLRFAIFGFITVYLALAEYKWKSRALAMGSHIGIISISIIGIFYYGVAFIMPLITI